MDVADVRDSSGAVKPPVAPDEFRDGQRINPNPVVALTTPKAPPALAGSDLASSNALDEAATSAIPQDLEKYKEILRNVSLFKEMGDEELEVAARALEIRHFRAGHMIYDEGDEGYDCWVLEEGTVVSSMLIPGIAGAGVEWKETRPYKPGKFGSFFGERGLRRGEPRPARMICRTEVKALRITQVRERWDSEWIPNCSAHALASTLLVSRTITSMSRVSGSIRRICSVRWSCSPR